MEKRRLGAGGPMVSPIGIGAMSFAGVYGNATEDAAHAILDAALELGIDHIDTSNVYGMGRSEEIIGRFLARHGGAAQEVFRIATKAGITSDPETGQRCFDNAPEHLEAEIDGSLKRLGLDRVDLFYVHRWDRRIPIEEVTGTLVRLMEKGKIRSFGFSEIAPSSLRDAAAVHPVAAVQSEYSLSTRAPELGLVQECARLGTALVAFCPVGRGLLTDTPPAPERIAASGFLAGNPRFVEPSYSKNIAATDEFRTLAADLGVPTAALSIAWLLSRGEGVIPIPGTRSVAHLKELAAGADLRLSDGDLARIEEVLPAGWAHGDRYTDEQWIGVARYS
ncbi:aldo/keto reductase [Amaricoccus macauensis]|uniref:aldo/keto reductase n=1 Tax=Amaricoccus macauensis TaxID=57001 RepID=UPI003C7C0952